MFLRHGISDLVGTRIGQQTMESCFSQFHVAFIYIAWYISSVLGNNTLAEFSVKTLYTPILAQF